MKKVLTLFFLALITASCFTLKERGRSEYVYYLDYQKYTAAGFFLSPTDYPGKYESIGFMQIDVQPEIVETATDYIYPEYEPREIPAEELLESIVTKAIEKGANGISNLSIKRITTTIYTKYATTTSLSHYEVSGLLIMCK